jgi:hypothetical protein
MEKTSQRKRVGRKCRIEKIYLSGEEIIEIIEISEKLGDYPHSSLFTCNFSKKFIYEISNYYRWKLEFYSVNRQNGRFQYKINTTTRNNRIHNLLILLELEENYLLNLIDKINQNK